LISVSIDFLRSRPASKHEQYTGAASSSQPGESIIRLMR
jgi:hypothetical protein